MEEPEYVTIFDLESGHPIRVTKETRDKYLEMFKCAMPKLTSNNANLGQVFLFGTGGDMDGNNSDFYKLFYNNKTNNMKEQIATFRFEADALIGVVSALQPSAELTKCLNSLKMTKAWLGKLMGGFGGESPYKNDGKRKDAKDIEPTDAKVDDFKKILDLLKTLMVDTHTEDFETMNHVQKVDYVRQVLTAFNNKLEKFILEDCKMEGDKLDSKDQHKVFLPCMSIMVHLPEARFWLGFELQRIREAEDKK